MIVRPLIGLAVACSLAGCSGASELAESEPAAISSPPAPSAAAAPSIAPAASDVIHDLRTGIESPLPDAIQALGGSNYDLSPDGTKLAFDAYIDGYSQVMVASRNGTWARQVTHRRCDAADPRWSPSGDRLVYECGKTILVTNLSRGHTVRLTGRHGLLEQPSFMADGRRVLFTRITPKHTDLWTAPSGADEAPCSSPRRRGAYLHRWEERSRFIAFKERSNPPPGGPISAASLWSTSMASHLGR